MVALFIGILTN